MPLPSNSPPDHNVAPRCTRQGCTWKMLLGSTLLALSPTAAQSQGLPASARWTLAPLPKGRVSALLTTYTIISSSFIFQPSTDNTWRVSDSSEVLLSENPSLKSRKAEHKSRNWSIPNHKLLPKKCSPIVCVIKDCKTANMKLPDGEIKKTRLREHPANMQSTFIETIINFKNTG